MARPASRSGRCTFAATATGLSRRAPRSRRPIADDRLRRRYLRTVDATDLLERRVRATADRTCRRAGQARVYAWFLDDPSSLRTLPNQGADPITSESATTFSVAVTRTTFGPAGAAFRLCAAHSGLSSRNSSAYQRCREAPARASRISAATSSTTPASYASAIGWASTFGSRFYRIRSRSRSSEKSSSWRVHH